MGDDGPAGSFFNPVPDNERNEEVKKDLDESLEDLLRQRKQPPKASSPSTINGIPTSQATGFGKVQSPSPAKSSKPFVGIGPPDKPLNDVSNPEYDDQGYTLYVDEKTGKKTRVFEALVEYPCAFTMKIVGAKEGTFVEDIVQIVADSCEEDVETIKFSTKVLGKWTSITVEAPVKNAEMLYMLYENVDRDPRVKFKF
jgi:putative lipoic acid-binding regulatory protein